MVLDNFGICDQADGGLGWKSTLLLLFKVALFKKMNHISNKGSMNIFKEVNFSQASHHLSTHRIKCEWF